MQALYSFWSSGTDKEEYQAERDMMNSINKMYELYLFLLLFTKELCSLAEKYDSEVRDNNIPSAREINMHKNFYTNVLIEKLDSSELLEKELKKYKLLWDSEDLSMLRKVFVNLKTSDVYKDFIYEKDPKEEQLFELFSFILKHYTVNFSLVDQFLEDKFFNWLDDSKVAVQMAVKTFKNILSDPENEVFLLPLSHDDDVSFSFAKDLFKETVARKKENEELIAAKIEKWEPSRIPLLDSIILQMGVTEFLFFANIPVKVTINECIELSKNYSTPNSKKFINGVLDNLLIDFEKEKRINKKGIGLIDK
ncbi:MAG: transcription antitermination factor NusB [Bacteroidetes bacterium]|jgi:N utilization substance protein B|nr:transcription antitermination factor NusB [Bacteroidota bacterium]MBT5528714.1 transcription antitermination factor NusB [Cytophagia bacterium]MBT3422486.1 transcription antitermination factor NusB [Bacteroidota bacterium]MBT3800319.1 transcription antitermination factor NusB [Bacteroidota bacterium]MBT4337230.1 transcription antitermination factor NusB [Bacteroidota bacterium]